MLETRQSVTSRGAAEHRRQERDDCANDGGRKRERLREKERERLILLGWRAMTDDGGSERRIGLSVSVSRRHIDFLISQRDVVGFQLRPKWNNDMMTLRFISAVALRVTERSPDTITSNGAL